MTRTKRGFGTIRKRSSGRYEAFYMGPDQGIHRAPATFDVKSDAEAWLARERRLIQDDQWDQIAHALATSTNEAHLRFDPESPLADTRWPYDTP